MNTTPFINAPTSLEEALSNRAVKDVLITINHPVEWKTDRGFTYLDLVLWRIKQGHREDRILSDIISKLEWARQAELKEAIVRG